MYTVFYMYQSFYFKKTVKNSKLKKHTQVLHKHKSHVYFINLMKKHKAVKGNKQY